MAIRRVLKELKDIKTFEQDYRNKQYIADVELEDIDLLKSAEKHITKPILCKGYIQGPLGTPYQFGTYNLKIIFPIKYPFCPPEMTMITKIYHPKINEKGNIHLGILRKEHWCPALTISKVCYLIIELLQDPLPWGCCELNPSAARHYKNNRNEFWRIASKYNKQWADADKIQFDDDSVYLLRPFTVCTVHKIYDVIDTQLTDNIFNGNVNLTNIVIKYFGLKQNEIKLCSDYSEYEVEIQQKQIECLSKNQGEQNMIIFVEKYGKKLTIKVNVMDFVYYLKKIIMDLEDINVEQMRLLFVGKEMEDDKRLKYYNVSSQSTIKMIARFRCAGG